MNIEEISEVVQNFFGDNGKIQYINIAKKELGYILYDTFLLVCDVNDRYDRFGIGIAGGYSRTYITNFLGKRGNLDSREIYVRESLQVVDAYCRMRLPDKYWQEKNKKIEKENLLCKKGMKIMEPVELCRYIKNYYGYKAKVMFHNSGTNSVGWIMYNSFWFEACIDKDTHKFNAKILLGNDEYSSSVFNGDECSCENDENLISNCLQVVDNYCRLRLPDKFLEAYDRTYLS